MRSARVAGRMPADGVYGIDEMRDARWKQSDEMKSADEMEIWGVSWRGRDGKIVPALKTALRLADLGHLAAQPCHAEK